MTRRTRTIGKSYTLPPGRYWVGDPCYFVEDKYWDDFCTEYFKQDTNQEDVVRVELTSTEMRESIVVYAASTAYGDGEYPEETTGFVFGVDAGMLGIVRVPDDMPVGEVYEGGVFEFPSEFEVSTSGTVIRFGHIVINTGF